MMNATGYEQFIVLFRRMKYLAVVEVLVGFLVGVLAGGTPRVVIWLVATVLALWTFTTGFHLQRKYRRLLARSQAAQSESATNTPSNGMPLEIRLASDAQRDHSQEMSVPQSDASEETPQEASRVATMLNFEHQFVGLALGSAAIAVVFIIWGFFLVGPARVVVIGCSVVGGCLLSGFFLLIKRRMRTGPKAEYLREGWKGY
jgi:hypothetical protein